MPREKSDALFQLIKSLSKNEKRYFKIYSLKGGDGDTKTLQLFNTLHDQEVFDEDEVLEMNPDFNPTQMSNLKAELYKQLLQSLRLYHDGKIVDIKIRQLIDFAQLLYSRCLYHQSYSQLKKAKKLAQKHENLELMLEIGRLEKNVISYIIDNQNQKRVNKIVAEVSHINEKINLINQLSNLESKLNSLYKKVGFIRDKRDHMAVENYLQKNLPEYNRDDLTESEKIQLHNLYFGYYFFIQDFENGNREARDLVNLFENNKSLIATKTESYIQALNRLAISESKLSNYNAFVEAVNKIQSVSDNSGVILNDDIRSRLYKYYYLHEMNRYFMLGDFQGGVDMLASIQDGLEKFIENLDQHTAIIFYYKIACMYFGNSEYSKAIVWLNKIINMTEVDIRRDIHCFARILNLVAHYEVGNLDVIDYYIRSTYRFLAKKYDLRLYQQYILSFLKNLPNNQRPTDLKKEFESLRTQLLTLRDRPYERRAFIYFDIISWLESKISGQPIGDVIREKALKSINSEGITVS